MITCILSGLLSVKPDSYKIFNTKVMMLILGPGFYPRGFIKFMQLTSLLQEDTYGG